MSGSFNFKDWQNWGRSKPNEPQSGGAEPSSDKAKQPFVEEIRVSGQNLVDEIERLLREGGISRIRIRQNDKVLVDLPVTFAIVGLLLAPTLAAISAVAAVVADCTVEVYRNESAPPKAAQPGPAPSGAKGPDDLSYR
jgi:hypothetical protein